MNETTDEELWVRLVVAALRRTSLDRALAIADQILCRRWRDLRGAAGQAQASSTRPVQDDPHARWRPLADAASRCVERSSACATPTEEDHSPWPLARWLGNSSRVATG